MTAENPLLPKPREQVVELFSGDFEPRLQELKRQLSDAVEQETAARRFAGGSGESQRIAEEYDGPSGEPAVATV